MLFLQEDRRSIPENLSLQLGLDPSLEGDRSAVEQQFVDLPRVQVKPVLDGEIDYIVGRMTAEHRAFLIFNAELLYKVMMLFYN